MKRFAVLMVLIVAAAACGRSPVGPTVAPPTPTGPPPQAEMTLSGTVVGTTAGGPKPLEGAKVWTDQGSTWCLTGADGRYGRITVNPGTLRVFAQADHYRVESRTVTITQDTTIDFQLLPE